MINETRAIMFMKTFTISPLKNSFESVLLTNIVCYTYLNEMRLLKKGKILINSCLTNLSIFKVLLRSRKGFFAFENGLY